MFNGHQLYTIGEEWVFDLTEFIGYRIKIKNSKVQSYERVFTVKRDKSYGYKFDKQTAIPLGVMRKSRMIIENYMRDALIDA